MKTCTRFHTEDIEPGDRLFLSSEWGSEPEYPEGVTLAVRSKYRSHNFGWIITDINGVEYYLNDFDIIKLVESEDAADFRGPGNGEPCV